MGYYSKVVITIEKSIYDKLINMCKTDDAFKKYKVYESLLCNFDQMYFKNNVYMIVYESKKWYLEFPEISLLENFIIQESDSNNKNKEISFFRVGEEYDDIEELGYSPTFGVYIYRDIAYNI